MIGSGSPALGPHPAEQGGVVVTANASAVMLASDGKPGWVGSAEVAGLSDAPLVVVPGGTDTGGHLSMQRLVVDAVVWR